MINERKIERFREIVREATEQCGGNLLPSIVFMENGIPTPENGNSYVLHTEEKEGKSIREIDICRKPVNIFIGPEGGWSETEMSSFQKRDMQIIHL